MTSAEMSEWRKVNLADVTIGKGEYGSGASAVEYDSTRPRYVRITDINDDGQLKSTDNRSPSDIEPQYFLEQGDFLFARSGSVGRTYVHTARSGQYQYAGYLIRFKLNRSIILPKFLFYLTRSPQYREWVRNQQKSVTISNINAKQYAEFSFLLPPLHVQSKLVSVLDRINEARAARKDSNELSRSLLRAVFFQMFGDPLTNSKKWKLAQIREFGRVVTGNTPSRKVPENYGGYIEWIKSDNLGTPSGMASAAKEHLSKTGAKIGRIAPAGSILVTCIAGSLASIGNAAVTDRDVAFNQQINAVVPDKVVDAEFLYQTLVLNRAKIQNSATKAMKKMVSKSTFERIPLICPPIELQKRFGDMVRQCRSLIEHQLASTKLLDDICGRMLQDLGRAI